MSEEFVGFQTAPKMQIQASQGYGILDRIIFKLKQI